MEMAKDFSLVSIGIDEINDGIKNPKRFRVMKLQTIFFAIFTFIVNLFLISNYFYSFLKADILPDYS